MPISRTRARGHRRQNAHLTYRENRDRGRHGWLRLTPAYSVTLVEKLVASRPPGSRILDPFSGTGTTPLASISSGRCAVSLDLNPFLVWLGNAKLGHYAAEDLSRFDSTLDRIGVALSSADGPRVLAPPIKNIERWWQSGALAELCRLKAALEGALPADCPAKDLLRLAFCQTMINSSNAAFNHQSMSFKKNASLPPCDDTPRPGEMFTRYAMEIRASAASNGFAEGKVLPGDARNVGRALSDQGKFDTVITSPPYVNRMSYIRELRPYMYWLGYLGEAREAGELDWRAIGGTWGVATSRLKEWERPKEVSLPDRVAEAVHGIGAAEEKNAQLMAAYVEKYFADMGAHFASLRPVLRPGAEVHYIVGNSKFYDVLVQAQEIYAEMLQSRGFESIEVRTLRKRNSKKELFEYDVVARLSG